MEKAKQIISRWPALPILKRISPNDDQPATDESLLGFKRCQNLAYKGIKEIAAMIQPGWTEQKTADLLDTYLMDHGVQSFFHRSFVWFGSRTKFSGVENYLGFLPTQNKVEENDVIILDVAPILNGFSCDVGKSFCLGDNPDFIKTELYLKALKKKIPEFFKRYDNGADVCERIDHEISLAGYENIHQLYPFSVLGHRIHKVPNALPAHLANIGWQSYWSMLSQGEFSELLSKDFQGDLTGLWAIEPHVGTSSFGVKFEEILVVESNQVYWLQDLEEGN